MVAQAGGLTDRGAPVISQAPSTLGMWTSPTPLGKQRGSDMRVEWKCLGTEPRLHPPGPVHSEEWEEFLKALCNADRPLFSLGPLGLIILSSRLSGVLSC